jgi:hypothetical protein
VRVLVSASLQDVFTYGVPAIFVIFVLVTVRRLRQKQPGADAIESEPVIFTRRVRISFTGGGTTSRDLIVREHSFELPDPVEPWFVRGAYAQIEVTNQRFGLFGGSQRCIAMRFPEGAKLVNLWLFPEDSDLRATWDALVLAGVQPVGTPPEDQ